MHIIRRWNGFITRVIARKDEEQDECEQDKAHIGGEVVLLMLMWFLPRLRLLLLFLLWSLAPWSLSCARG